MSSKCAEAKFITHSPLFHSHNISIVRRIMHPNWKKLHYVNFTYFVFQYFVSLYIPCFLKTTYLNIFEKLIFLWVKIIQLFMYNLYTRKARNNGE